MITARDPIGRLVYSDYTNTTAMNRWIQRMFLTCLCDRQIFAGIRIWQFIQWLSTHNMARYEVTVEFTKTYILTSTQRHEVCILTKKEVKEVEKRLYKEGI